MLVRKITAALIGTVLTASALAGCAPAPGTSSSFGCTPLSEGSGTVLSNVSVSGEFAAKPKVSVPAAFTVSDVEREETIVGDGAQITSLTQVGAFELTLISTTDGSVISQSEYAGAPGHAPVGVAVSAIDGFGASLMCARAGSRVVATFPSSTLDPSQAAQLGLTESTGILAVVDVIDVMKAAADGAPEFNAAWGMPSVVRTPDGHPGVVVPGTAAPSAITVQTLLKGDGPALTDADSAVVNILGTTWDPQVAGEQRSTFVDSWADTAPQVVSFADPTALPAGFQKALEGATVGSQVLLVVPASENTSTGSGTPAGATLIYVIDVLGTL